MGLRINSHDIELLLSLAEHRVLTANHLAALHGRNVPALRRRLRVLARVGLVRASDGGLVERPGRPERLYSLMEDGSQLLRERGMLAASAALDDTTGRGVRHLRHLLAVNDFRVHLELVQRLVPDLAVQFLSPGPLRKGTKGSAWPIIHERFHVQDGGDRLVEFTPDGVFSVSHTPTDRALLFFLEVDMGTESLVSKRHPHHDVRRKVANYQTYFRLARYKRYEEMFGSGFRGFRLLIVAGAPGRCASLCGLVRNMPPSDFVWLTDLDSVRSEGIWSLTWARGGRVGRPLESILGRLMPNASLPPASLM